MFFYIGIATIVSSIVLFASQNTITVYTAKKIKIHTIGFLGMKGGNVKNKLDTSILVKSNNVARIQEAHIFIGHIILDQVEKLLLGK